MREDERQLVIRGLQREAWGIRGTLAGSAVLLVLVARLALGMGRLWVAVLAGAGAFFLWVRLYRRLGAIQRDLRMRGARGGAGRPVTEDAISPARLALMMLSVLVSVGLCFLLFVWLAEKLR